MIGSLFATNTSGAGSILSIEMAIYFIHKTYITLRLSKSVLPFAAIYIKF